MKRGVVGALFGAVLGLVVSVLSLELTDDPWFGAHSAIVCPRVCEGCRGPYVSLTVTTATATSRYHSSATTVYCTAPGAGIEALTPAERLQGAEGLSRYAVPGGMTSLLAPTALFSGLLGSVFFARRRSSSNPAAPPRATPDGAG